MPKRARPRYGSLQFWPRKRARRILPRVNWRALENRPSKSGFLGFVGYKAGMVSSVVLDKTPDSLTANKKIVLPLTVLECPPLRVFGVRLYKGKRVVCDILAPELSPELKRKLYLPRKERKVNVSEFLSKTDYDNVRLLAHTQPRLARLKKTPEIFELGLTGSLSEKSKIAESRLGKEISISEVFDAGQVSDIHAVTKGKGFAGPVKRFGIALKQYKSEKGVRRPGSLGPWTPKRVTFRAPMAGQLGYFTRTQFNAKLIGLGKLTGSLLEGRAFKHYGMLRSDYCLVKGSLPGPRKRPIFLTYAQRPTNAVEKESYELLRIV